MGRSKVSAVLGAALAFCLAGPGELRAADPDRPVACRAQVVSRADLRALRVLQRPPFAPTDVSLFMPQVYPAAPAPQPAGPYSFTEESLRARVSDLLARRFRGQVRRVRAGLAVFDDTAIKAVVPDPRLRAGLALLTGTAGEAAIGAVRGGVYQEVRFASGLPPETAAMVGLPPGAAKSSIFFNERYEFEDPLLFADLFAHETLHQDSAITNKEELIASGLEILVYGELLLETPALATSGTEFSRRLNTKLMARLNGRDESGLLRLLTAQGSVYPGGTFLPNFAAAFGALGGDTPGNAVLRAELRAATGSSSGGAGFDDRTVALLDRCQRLLSPSEVLRLARILRLDTGG